MHTIKQLVSLLLFYLLLIVAIGQYVGLLALCTHVRPTVEALIKIFAATKNNNKNNNNNNNKKQKKTKKTNKDTMYICWLCERCFIPEQKSKC